MCLGHTTILFLLTHLLTMSRSPNFACHYSPFKEPVWDAKQNDSLSCNNWATWITVTYCDTKLQQPFDYEKALSWECFSCCRGFPLTSSLSCASCRQEYPGVCCCWGQGYSDFSTYKLFLVTELFHFFGATKYVGFLFCKIKQVYSLWKKALGNTFPLTSLAMTFLRMELLLSNRIEVWCSSVFWYFSGIEI